MKPYPKYLFLLFLTALIAACGPSGNHFKIEGRFSDMQEGELYIYNMSSTNARFDTLRVKGGTFVYQGTADEPTPYMLVFPNAVEQVIFVDAGKTLEYEASTTDLKNYTVKGSDENKLLNEFREQTKTMTAIKTKAAARTFIEEHPASAVSIYMLDRFFVQDENIVSDEIVQMAGLLQKHHPNNVFLIDLQTMGKQIDNSAVGKMLPKITLEAYSGNTVNLSALDKSYTLIVFWATWMDEQWNFIPDMRKYARDYSEQMKVVAISLDTQTYRWQETVGDDSLTFDNVFDGKGWDSPAVSKFGVRNVPYYVLADSKGKIVANGYTLKSMEKDVEKYVSKNSKPAITTADSVGTLPGNHFDGPKPMRPATPVPIKPAQGAGPSPVAEPAPIKVK